MDKGKNISEYDYRDGTGDAQMLVYRLFPGVEAAYISVHMTDIDFGTFEQAELKKCLTLHYCREGHIEQEIEQEFFYLMPGDCSISIQNGSPGSFRLPLKHYHGIRIRIDPDRICDPLLSYLENCHCPVLDAISHICTGKAHIVLRSSEMAGEFFNTFYQVSAEYRLDFLRTKIPELFYHMKHAAADSSHYDRKHVPGTQVELVKAVSEHILRNLNEKITVKQLARDFGISDTCLQNAFRSVYGMPVIRFIRLRKMQSAAQILLYTTCTIDEIAESFGYENESKFSAAFKKIMGDPPGLYRKEHTKIRII